MYRKLYCITFKTPRGDSFSSHILMSDMKLEASDIKKWRKKSYDYDCKIIDDKEEEK